MTTLEERIAEAVAKVHADFGIGEDDGPGPEAYARAVVAVLPTADVSDEAIRETLLAARTPCPCEAPGCPDIRPVGEWGVDRVLPSVRALLDAQAAAHAAQMEALRAKIERMGNAADTLGELLLTAEAEVEALRAKRGALQDHAYKVAQDATAAEADRDAHRARIDKVRGHPPKEVAGD